MEHALMEVTSVVPESNSHGTKLTGKSFDPPYPDKTELSNDELLEHELKVNILS